MKIKRVLIVIPILFVILGTVIFFWNFFLLPTSINEIIFRHRLTERTSENVSSISLSDLMPGDWELVCDSHGYSGQLYLKKYNKTFPPNAPPHDRVWGLIFIDKNGSYTPAVRPYGKNIAYLSIEPYGCLERSKAVLVRFPKQKLYYGTEKELEKLAEYQPTHLSSTGLR